MQYDFQTRKIKIASSKNSEVTIGGLDMPTLSAAGLASLQPKAIDKVRPEIL